MHRLIGGAPCAQGRGNLALVVLVWLRSLAFGGPGGELGAGSEAKLLTTYYNSSAVRRPR
jgi:hypothetical protein